MNGQNATTWYSPDEIEKLQRLDVLCPSATGDGKSAPMYLPSITRKGTITLAICPTNFLQSDLAAGFRKKGVTAQVINSETLAAATLEGQDLWSEAKTGAHQIMLFEPETTLLDEWDDFVNGPSARSWIGKWKGHSPDH